MTCVCSPPTHPPTNLIPEKSFTLEVLPKLHSECSETNNCDQQCISTATIRLDPVTVNSTLNDPVPSQKDSMDSRNFSRGMPTKIIHSSKAIESIELGKICAM